MMNPSTKLGAILLAGAMSLGISTNASAQGAPVSILGATIPAAAVPVAIAVTIGLVGAVAIESAGANDGGGAVGGTTPTPPPATTTTTTTTGT